MFTRRIIVAAVPAYIAACAEVKPNLPGLAAAPVSRVRADLYQCEGCEGARERGARALTWQARIGPPDEPGEALRIDGTVFETDGKTPAAGVIIYAYQTNAAGLYANGTAESEWSRRHGNLRGWVKTGADGRYRFDTIKPAPYPGEAFPAHLHFTVLEPGRPPYWIDDIVFASEFGVTETYRRGRENRGGDGIVLLARDQSVWLAKRDILLEPHA
jgi:protocatechuate 3,4-dioxygenase, beta subunit